MPRWLLTMIVVDSVVIPAGVVLILVGSTTAGIVVLALDAVLMPLIFFLGGGLGDQARRNAELSARGMPGKDGPASQQGTEARIFEE